MKTDKPETHVWNKILEHLKHVSVISLWYWRNKMDLQTQKSETQATTSETNLEDLKHVSVIALWKWEIKLDFQAKSLKMKIESENAFGCSANTSDIEMWHWNMNLSTKLGFPKNKTWNASWKWKLNLDFQKQKPDMQAGIENSTWIFKNKKPETQAEIGNSKRCSPQTKPETQAEIENSKRISPNKKTWNASWNDQKMMHY